jgi:hypothetical protein
MAQERKVSSVCSDCGAPISFRPGDPTVICGFCDARLTVERGSRLLLLRCPRCDGNFFSPDGGLSGECPFCNTPVVAITRGQLHRFVIRPQADPPASDCELLFVPFWQLTALYYGWDLGAHVTYEVDSDMQMSQSDGEAQGLPMTTRKDSGPQKVFRGRVVERWLADPSAMSLGIQSLRLRAAIYPVESYSEDMRELGRFMPASLDLEQAKDGLMTAAMGLGSAGDGINRLDCQRAELIAETFSLLYYPFYVRRVSGIEAWDAVRGEVEPLHPPQPAPDGEFTSGFDQLTVLELSCQHCGHRLKPANRARVFPCHHCNTFWEATAEGLNPFNAQYAQPIEKPPAGQRLLWLPFWRVGARVRFTDRLATKGIDMRNTLGIFSPGQLAEPQAPLCYYAPAYGALKAPRLDFAARDMTRLQPRLEAGPYQQGDDFGCFLGPDDARRLAYVVWMQQLNISAPRKLASLRVETGDITLWYVPFADGGRELKNLLTGMRYDRVVFRGVGH